MSHLSPDGRNAEEGGYRELASPPSNSHNQQVLTRSIKQASKDSRFKALVASQLEASLNDHATLTGASSPIIEEIKEDIEEIAETPRHQSA